MLRYLWPIWQDAASVVISGPTMVVMPPLRKKWINQNWIRLKNQNTYHTLRSRVVICLPSVDVDVCIAFCTVFQNYSLWGLALCLSWSWPIWLVGVGGKHWVCLPPQLPLFCFLSKKTSGAGFIAFLLVNRNVDIFRGIHRNHFQWHFRLCSQHHICFFSFEAQGMYIDSNSEKCSLTERRSHIIKMEI